MAAAKEWYDTDETRQLVLLNSDSERGELSSDFESESSDDDSSNSRANDGDDRAESAQESDIEMSADEENLPRERRNRRATVRPK